jgi:cellulose synthase operon protein C
VLESVLGDPQRASSHYRRALEHRPEHLPTVHAARRLLVELGQWEAALPLFDAEVRLWAEPARKAELWHEKGRLLERHLGRRADARAAYSAAFALEPGHPGWLRAVLRMALTERDWAAADGILEQAAASSTADPAQLAALVALRARLQEKRAENRELATDLYRRAVELDPLAPGALRALGRLYHAQSRWRDLGQILELEARAFTESRARALALGRAARVHETRLGDLATSIALLAQALGEAPDEELLLREYARLLRRTERHTELGPVLEKLVECAGHAGERIARALELGRLAELELGDESAAIRWYRRVLDEDPTHLGALGALGGLYARRSEWKELVTVLRREAAVTSDAARQAEALVRIADLSEHRLADRNGAVEAYAQALVAVPLHPAAFRELARLYAEGGRHHDLIELLERAADAAGDEETRVTHLMRIGQLEEEALGAPERAVFTYQRVLESSPGHLGAIHALERAAERAGHFRELVSALELEVDRLGDSARRVPLLTRAGDLLAERLGDPEGALARWRRALSLEPRHAPTLRALVVWLGRLGRWEELLDAELNLVAALGTTPEAVTLLLEAGQLCETRLGDVDKARRCYARALRADPGSSAALHALEQIAATRADWQELARLLGLEQEIAKTPSQAAILSLQLGELFEDRLGRTDRALAEYERALGAVPELTPALDGRDRLLGMAGEWRRLGECLADEAKRTGDVCLGVGALLASAELWRDDLGDSARAAELLGAALERDPTNRGALLGLEWMHTELGNTRGLAAVLGAEARALGSVAGRAAALRELVELRKAEADGDPEELERLWLGVLDLSPMDTEALERLERLALARQDSGLLLHVDAKLGALWREGGLAAAHVGRLGAALEASGDAAALDTYRAALAHDPESLWATRGFTRLARRAADPGLLEEAAGYEARVGHDNATAAEVLVASAELRLARSGDRDGSLRCLEKALDLDPTSTAALGALRAALLERGETDRLLDQVTHAARQATDPEASARLWLVVAEIQADERRDTGAGLAAVGRALGSVKDYVPALLYGAELLGRAGQWTSAVERFEKVVALDPPREHLVRAHLALCDLFADRLGDNDRALEELGCALQLEPGDRVVLGRAADLYQKAGRLDDAVRTLRSLVESTRAPEELGTSLSKLGRLEQARGQAEAALGAYERAVSLVGLGLGGQPARELRELLGTLGPQSGPGWQRYVGALGRRAQEVGPTHAEWRGLLLESARVFGDQMGRADTALVTLEHGVAGAPADLEIRRELAGRLLAAGRLPEAVDQFRAVLELDPMQADAWRGLVRAWQSGDRPAESALAAAPLVWLGAATDQERAAWQARAQRPAGAFAGSFDSLAWRLVAPSLEADPTVELLGSLRETWGALYPPALERFGLSQRDRIGARSPRPLRQLVDRLAAAFGNPEFDLYVHQAHGGLPELMFTDPPAILVPSHVTSLNEGQQVFVFGRMLATLSRGLGVAEALSPTALGQLLVAAARTVEPGFGLGQHDEQELGALSRRLGRVVSWRTRRTLEDAARRYVANPPTALGDFLATLRAGAARAALILSDNLPGAAVLVRRYEGDLSGLDLGAVTQGTALLRDLLRFWVSDAAFALRHRLGMAG